MNYFFTCLLAFLMLCQNCAQAFEIVYPKSQNAVIDSPNTAFIGNERDTSFLKINGQNVSLHKSGGFKHPVGLKFGKNIFVIDNGVTQKTYTIIRNQYIQQSSPFSAKPSFFNKSKIIVTSENNAILRSTPVDKGLNRLAHLPEGIMFEAVGEYNNFYKVLLGRDDIGWIAKSQTKTSELNITPVSNIKYFSDSDSEKETYKFFTSGVKLPYVLSESDDGLFLTIYGVDTNNYQFGKYEFNIPHSGNLQGYRAFYDEDNNLIISVNKNRKNLKWLNITIDAGHGGREYGAIGCLGDKEKDINLKIALKLKEILLRAGANVFLTRDTDRYLSLNDRVKYTKDNGSEVFISIHANALPDSLLNRDISGTEVYYFYPQAKNLAKSLLNSIVSNAGTKNNGVKGESFAVIRNTSAVSVLVEVAYIINPEENVLLRDDEFQQKVAESILKGLENYLK